MEALHEIERCYCQTVLNEKNYFFQRLKFGAIGLTGSCAQHHAVLYGKCACVTVKEAVISNLPWGTEAVLYLPAMKCLKIVSVFS